MPGRGPPSNVRRRTFHWDAIPPHKLHNTVWSDVGGTADIDLVSLESLFTKANSPTKTAGNNGGKGDPSPMGGKRLSVGSGRVVITLLDMKRASNVEIMLSQIKTADKGAMSIQDVVAAVGTLDASGVLEVEHVSAMLRFLPTAEEAKMLQAWTGDVEVLGKAEQYFLLLSKIEGHEAKLETLELKHSFKAAEQELNAHIAAVSRGCGEVLASGRLRRVLETVLAVGNSLNTGRMKARGFKLASLHKLMDTRSFDGKTSLLHYIVATLSKKSPELLAMREELPSLSDAMKRSFAVLDAEMAPLQRGLLATGDELAAAQRAAAEGGSDAEREYAESLRAFHAHAKSRLEASAASLADARAWFRRVAEYFGEDPGSLNDGQEPERFLGDLCSFLNLIESASKDKTKLLRVHVAASPPPAAKE